MNSSDVKKIARIVRKIITGELEKTGCFKKVISTTKLDEFCQVKTSKGGFVLDFDRVSDLISKEFGVVLPPTNYNSVGDIINELVAIITQKESSVTDIPSAPAAKIDDAPAVLEKKNATGATSNSDGIIEIKWYTKSASLSQESSSGVEFSLVSEDLVQVTPFFYCKDFIQDAFWGTFNAKPTSIYRFDFDPKEGTPAITKAKLLVANAQDADLKSKIANCIDFIHQVESEMKFNFRTKFDLCKGQPKAKYARSGVYLITGSKRWIKSPVLISMYVLLLRVGFAHEIGKNWRETINSIISGKKTPYYSIDKSRLSSSIKNIESIIKHGDGLFSIDPKYNYPPDFSISDVHNCGICHYGDYLDRVKSWKSRLKLAEKGELTPGLVLSKKPKKKKEKA